MLKKNSNKERNYEFWSFILIILGVVFIVSFIIIFFIGEYNSIKIGKIKSDKFGQFGDIIGGVVGSIWALAGVLMFYAALKKQIEALENQKEATKASIESISLQYKELELQRKELEETREVFKQQHTTLKLQQFENTFFNLMSLLNTALDNMVIQKIEKRETKAGFSINENGVPISRGTLSGSYVEPEYENLIVKHTGREFLKIINSQFKKKRKEDGYVEIYNTYNEYKIALTPYLNLIKQILRKLDNSPYKEYSEILKAQTSSAEIELLLVLKEVKILDSDLIDLLNEYLFLE